MLDQFHPLVAGWFGDSFAAPTPIQTDGWAHIAAGRDTLIAAPTGSGKTLAAFLAALDDLVRRGLDGRLEDRIHVVYVSPLKALGNDIQKNLQAPLAALAARAAAAGTPRPEIRVAVRSGDTPARERALQARQPPHILITTPESLYILLTAGGSRALLAATRTLILDEIHAVAADKRGAHLALSVERLDRLTGDRLQRIGLSATQKPIDTVARLLVGAGRCDADGAPRCAIVDAGHRRALTLSIETVDHELAGIASHTLRAAIYDRIAQLVGQHRTTIVFVHTRRLVERVAHALGERLGAERVAAHHGSMSRELRLAAEAQLKAGAVPVVVATGSLELGIDIGHVDLVVQLGAPRAIATLLQRVGRSGHSLGATPRGVLFPLTRDELMQSAAALRAVADGVLDALVIPQNARDVLAQQMVAIAAGEGAIAIEALWDLVRRAHPYRALPRDTFDAVLAMLADGVATRRGRRGAHLHLDRVHGVVRPRRGARLTAITGGGAIPDLADYDVLEDATNLKLGTVNEDFAIESLAGDVFQLGHHAWRIRRVEPGRVRVVDAAAAAPNMPFWLGEAPARTPERSDAVAALRGEVAARAHDRDASVRWLMAEAHVDSGGAEQVVDYVRATLAVLGAVPTTDTIIAERFFDEGGGMQLVLHAPFGGRINRALGLALRKRFCVSFDFELQAAATDDGVVISLGEQHSFPLESVFGMVRSHRFRDDLVQAALQAPMFGTRWRWTATRALALPRFGGGRRVPMPLQRMRADDLLAAVFPAQAACGDNHPGPVEPPQHPLVDQTLDDCLSEAMDADGLAEVLARIESGAIRTIAVDTAAPSPMSHELLNANPYAFLDDAPLEERRARAVALRRVDPDLAQGVGALDQAAIDAVREQAWPAPRDAEEVHDALRTLGVLPEVEAEPWRAWLDELSGAGRVQIFPGGAESFFVATEQLALATALAARDLDAIKDVVRGWMSCLGPTTAADLAARLGLEPDAVSGALEQLEGDGVVLRGRFGGPARPGTEESAPVTGHRSPGFTQEFSSDPHPHLPPLTRGKEPNQHALSHMASMDPIPSPAPRGKARMGVRSSLLGKARSPVTAVEWCERGLLARIHRRTLDRLRREIEPVAPADFARFLFVWQHLAPGTQLRGRDGLRLVIGQLQGLELPGPAWERDVLPARIADYDPDDLEHLCLAGEVAWGRL
ncbi:MAG: DEAD/DEAH box helicase, partial [Deltaproteobacteria bacterium]|nr:DEAD/DEAH box helicase [Deltaproteobacteria bacterium]